MTQIEVERRVRQDLTEIVSSLAGPITSEPIYIRDCYLSHNPKTGDLYRFRKATKGEFTVYKTTNKTPVEGHFYEDENKVSEDEYNRRTDLNRTDENMVSKVWGIVEGIRRKVEYKGVTICLDNVFGVGPCTEFEVLVNDEEHIKPAEEKIYAVAEELGIRKEDLTKDTYPIMLGIGPIDQNETNNYNS